MATILCKQCNIDKLKSEFHKNMRTCKDCFNTNRRKTYEILVNEPTPLAMLSIASKDFMELVAVSKKKNKFNIKLKQIWRHMGMIINQIETDGLPLSFKLNISDIVNEYFKTSIERGNSHSYMYRVLKNISYAKEFVNIFGITQLELDTEKNINEMQLITESLDAIKFAYNVFIEDENITNNCWIVTNPSPKIVDITSSYNPFTKSIDISKNPLHFTVKDFLERVEENRDDIRIQCTSAENIWERLAEAITQDIV